MKILVLRTDKPEAEVGLFENEKRLAYQKWQAYRELSGTIHVKLQEILDLSSISYGELGGIVIYKGPGSFTGLRIGMSVANALAYSLNVPIVAVCGDDWLKTGIKNLLAGKNDKIALPEYGSPPRTTTPRK